MSPLPDPNGEHLLMTTNKKETATGRSLFCRVFATTVMLVNYQPLTAPPWKISEAALYTSSV